jgi:hypothetical protein
MLQSTSLWAVPRTAPLTNFVMAMAVTRGAHPAPDKAPQVPALLRAPQQQLQDGLPRQAV